MLNVVKKFPVTHALHIGAAQIRWTRVLPAPDLGLAGTIVGMADLTFLGVDLVSARRRCRELTRQRALFALFIGE